MGSTNIIVRLATKRAPYRRGGFVFTSTRTPIDADPATLTEDNARRLHADGAITISVVQPAAGDAKEVVIGVLPARGTLEQIVAAKAAFAPAFPWIAANAKAAADAAQADADAKANADQDAADAAKAEEDAKATALATAATAAVQTAMAAAQPAPQPAAAAPVSDTSATGAAGKTAKAAGGAS